jgi:AraC family transcriptional regulator, ethanolamine operon transcriptional activator
MTRIVFNDFDEFADSIRGISGRFVPTARSQADWWVDVATVGRVDLQTLQIGGAATYAGDGTPNTLTLGIPMTDSRKIRIDGHALETDSLIYLKRDQPFTFAARQSTVWAGVTIALRGDGHEAELFDTERIMNTLDPGTRANSDPDHLDRLRRLISRVMTPDASVGFIDPAASSAAEEEVLTAVLHTIEASNATRDRHLGRPQVPRARVIARTLALIEANEGKPLFIDDLCRATDVSERTLRNVFHEYFGVGPMRLLKVRQLMEIRRALLAGDSSQETVARIAARFGVWDFSLFARNYKALYGESPSESLRRPPMKSASTLASSWVAYAGRMFLPIELAEHIGTTHQFGVTNSRG